MKIISCASIYHQMAVFRLYMSIIMMIFQASAGAISGIATAYLSAAAYLSKCKYCRLIDARKVLRRVSRRNNHFWHQAISATVK